MKRPIDGEAYMELLKEQYLHHKSMGNSQAAKAWQGAMQLLYDMPTLTPPNEWVSVEDRLPDELTMVLIYSGGIYDVAGWIEDEDGKICWTHNVKPQFWRPIPGLEPPGKDNNVPTKEQNEPLPVLINDEPDREYIDYICPRCKIIISQRRRGQRMETVYKCKFHDNCGQRVDWSNPQPYRRPPEGEI